MISSHGSRSELPTLLPFRPGCDRAIACWFWARIGHAGLEPPPSSSEGTLYHRAPSRLLRSISQSPPPRHASLPRPLPSQLIRHAQQLSTRRQDPSQPQHHSVVRPGSRLHRASVDFTSQAVLHGHT
jgi:hypothetical protein